MLAWYKWITCSGRYNWYILYIHIHILIHGANILFKGPRICESYIRIFLLGVQACLSWWPLGLMWLCVCVCVAVCVCVCVPASWLGVFVTQACMSGCGLELDS